MHGKCLRAVGGGGEKGWLVEDFVWLECTAEGSQSLLWYLAAGSPRSRLKLLSEYHASLRRKNWPDHKVIVIMRRGRQGKRGFKCDTYLPYRGWRKKKRGATSRFPEGDPFRRSYPIKQTRWTWDSLPCVKCKEAIPSPASGKICSFEILVLYPPSLRSRM